MRRKLVAGNWKMHGNFQQNAALLNRLVLGVNSLAAKSRFVYHFPTWGRCNLWLVVRVLLGAQNRSVSMQSVLLPARCRRHACRFGCRYVLVGHSERRAICTAKVMRSSRPSSLLRRQMVGACACVLVKRWLEREAGETRRLSRQLRGGVEFARVLLRLSAVLAYEPVWAIGTGLDCIPGSGAGGSC
jgi:triosephosphate isomerase